MRICLDSVTIIYPVEEVEPHASALESRLVVPGTVQVCSELARLECRVKPIRDGEHVVLDAFDRYFSGVVTEIVPLSRPVIDQATLLRAHYGIRTPDAIHLAAAIVSGCDLFLTNDRRLCRCREIAIEVI